MQEQMITLANLSLLGNFIGMLTDSRSFLSYPRHDYFRRILCNYLGGMMERGEMTQDMQLVGETVKNISYYNAIRYLKMD
jgi:glucuronate isomerase